MRALDAGPTFGISVDRKARRVVLTLEASADRAQQLAPILRTLHGLGVHAGRVPLSAAASYDQVMELYRAASRKT